MTEWSLSKVWGQALESVPKRTFEPRERLWASELYGSNIDLVLKLRGTEPTNPPDARALRKMDAGRMMEDFVELVLRRAGILHSSQDRIVFNEGNLLEVSGKLDFIAGGRPDRDMIAKMLEDIEDKTSFQARLLYSVLEILPDEELTKKILEIKSCSLFAYNKVEATGKPLSGHGLQAYHYARNSKMETSIVYICRDDLRMMEIPILPYMEDLEEKYIEKIRIVSDYYHSGELPEKEPLIEYDLVDGTFSKNFRVEYSNYLTMLYGFEKPAEYDEMFAKRVIAWNGVMKRIRAGKTMTKLNEERLKEIGEFGFDVEFITNHQKQFTPPVEEEIYE
jgi:hypothetical protein